MLSANGQKWLKAIHLIFVCCWVGGVFVLCLLFIPKASVESGGELYGINRAIHWADMGIVVIVGVLGSLLTGFIYGCQTKWGFFKHRWIMVKWIIAITVTLLGIVVLGPIEKELLTMSYHLGIDALTDPTYMNLEYWQMVLGAIPLVSLVFAVIISVLKPWGKNK